MGAIARRPDTPAWEAVRPSWTYGWQTFVEWALETCASGDDSQGRRDLALWVLHSLDVVEASMDAEITKRVDA
jgi:hypothetical protein